MEKLYGKKGTAPEVDASKAGSLKIEILCWGSLARTATC